MASERIPGYDRYHRYYKGVLRVKDPLGYLSDSEEMYWAVAEYLRLRNGEDSPKVVEVGCGYGYLTYSLSKRGVDIRGIDISETAVARARQTYGDHYECTDIAGLQRRGQTFDVVIATEVIEHVKDPVAFVETLGSILSPGGEIVVTTPNKAYYAPDAVWDTELPPVHHWWFSESSLRFLAHRIGYQVRFLDFSRYSKNHYTVPSREAKSSIPTRSPVLTQNGEVLHWGFRQAAVRLVRSLSKTAGVTQGVRTLQARLSTAISGPYRPRPTLCAIFNRS